MQETYTPAWNVKVNLPDVPLTPMGELYKSGTQSHIPVNVSSGVLNVPLLPGRYILFYDTGEYCMHAIGINVVEPIRITPRGEFHSQVSRP